VFDVISSQGRSLLHSMIWDVGMNVEVWSVCRCGRSIVQGHSDDELPENMLFVVYMSHVNLDEMGEDLVVDDVLREVEARKSFVAARSSQSASTSIPVVDAPTQEQFASSLSSPPSPSRVSSSSKLSSSADITAPQLSDLATALPTVTDDDEFHEVDEEFYDAES
jgi:hypothetical protein